MVEYNKVNVKLWDSQLNKLKAAATNQVNWKKLPHKLLLKLGFHYGLIWDNLRWYLNIFFLPSGNFSQNPCHKIATH